MGQTHAAGHPPAKDIVRYQALVLQVELRQGGELTYSSSRTLSDRGWGLSVEPEEALQFLQRAAERAMAMCRKDSPAVLVASEPPDPLASALEYVRVLTRDRSWVLSRSAVQAVARGDRVAFIEVCMNHLPLTLAVRATGMVAPEGLDPLPKLTEIILDKW